MNRSLVMIMAGGKGSRLGPLTCHRAKPATPFGGRYRIVDFVLSNFVNSGYQQIHLLTQYMAGSLIRHTNRTWHLSGYDAYIELAPAQMRRGEFWYRGTADSVYQNLNLIHDSRSEHVAIFGGDHIYKCAIDQMEEYHRDCRADLTIAAYPVPRSEADQFGVLQVDETGRVIGFEEKPAVPKPIPGQPNTCLVSMGNYFFRSEVLEPALHAMAQNPETRHDFGKDVIPSMLAQGLPIQAYDFRHNRVPGDENVTPYWRDVGTLDSYYAACMELRSPVENFNMYNRKWRIRTAQRHNPPARFVGGDEGNMVRIDDCMVCEGSVIKGAEVNQSIIGYDCQVRSRAEVHGSILMSGADVGEGAVLHNVLADKNCVFEPGVQIGVDPELDALRFPFRTEAGVIVIPKGTFVPVQGPIELAKDMGQLLLSDHSTQAAMADVPSKPIVSEHHRHSYRSAGPGTSLSP